MFLLRQYIKSPSCGINKDTKFPATKAQRTRSEGTKGIIIRVHSWTNGSPMLFIPPIHQIAFVTH